MTWDRTDHPLELPNIGNYALIVNPLVHHYELTKCLMDGGSSINIMYKIGRASCRERVCLYV